MAAGRQLESPKETRIASFKTVQNKITRPHHVGQPMRSADSGKPHTKQDTPSMTKSDFKYSKEVEEIDAWLKKLPSSVIEKHFRNLPPPEMQGVVFDDAEKPVNAENINMSLESALKNRTANLSQSSSSSSVSGASKSNVSASRLPNINSALLPRTIHAEDNSLINSGADKMIASHKRMIFISTSIVAVVILILIVTFSFIFGSNSSTAWRTIATNTTKTEIPNEDVENVTVGVNVTDSQIPNGNKIVRGVVYMHKLLLL